MRALPAEFGTVVGVAHTPLSTITVIERAQPIPPDVTIALPEGMHDVPIDPDVNGSRALLYLRHFTGSPAGARVCDVWVYSIENPSMYEREMDRTEVTDSMKSGTTYGYGFDITCLDD